MWNLFLGIAVALSIPCHAIAQDSAQDSIRPRPVRVQSVTLGEVGPWGAAALPEGIAPLTSDLWRGADPQTLSILFSKITPDQRFPSLQNLTRQAIFSGGAAPTSDPAISRQRFEVANRLGPAEATARLVFSVPRLASDPDLTAIGIDAGLRVGRIDDACSLIDAVAAPPSNLAWLEARAACYALNDEPAAANLTVDLAKSRGLTDTWLSRSIAAVAGPLTAPPPFRSDSGRAVALSLRANLRPPTTLSATQDPMALSALIGQPNFMASLPPGERLTLIRNGVSRGVVPVAAVANQQPEPEPETSAPLPPLPAQISQRLLAAPNLALRAFEGRNAADQLRSIMTTQPGLMTLSDVPILTEAALWAGDGPLASSIAALSPNALDPRLALVLALYDANNQNQIVQQRFDAASDPAARRLAMREVVIAWSAGLPVTTGLSTLVESGLPWGPAGNAGLRTALDLAANRGSKGEVILLTALATQGVEPASIDPETLISAVKALRQVGLMDAARNLARDYLFAIFVTLPARPIATRPRPAEPRAIAPSRAPSENTTPTAQSRAVTPPVVRAAPPAVPPSTALRPKPGPVTRASPRPASPPAARPAPEPVTSQTKPSWNIP
jgi:hypothetical protein